MNLKKELYRITDSFLTEAKNQNGEDRSLERLNEDRHLAVEEFMKLITQLLEELKMEKESDDNDIKRGDGELTNYIRGSWMGFNTCADEINSKINKILNK